MEIKKNIGIIGLGVGEAHIRGFEQHPNCKVVAVCDFSKEKRNYAHKNYPHLMVTSHPDQILEDPDIDVVSIASYDNYHYDQIIKAIKNEKHVFVEKPICMYEKEAKNIYSLLKKISFKNIF